MDKNKIFVSDETRAQNKSEKTKRENENRLESEELYASNNNQMSEEEFEPKLKRIRHEIEKYPVTSLEKDEESNRQFNQRTIQVTSEANSNQCTPDVAFLVTDNVHKFSQLSKFIKMSYVKSMSEIQLQGFENYNLGVSNTENTKAEAAKIIETEIEPLTLYNPQSQSESSTQSEDLSNEVTLASCSKKSTSVVLTEHEPVTIFQSLNNGLNQSEDLSKDVTLDSCFPQSTSGPITLCETVAKSTFLNVTSTQSEDVTLTPCSEQSTFKPLTQYESVVNSYSLNAALTQSEDLPKCDNLVSCSDQYTSGLLTPHDSVTNSQSLNVRSAEEVLEHFRWFMRSKQESSNTTILDGIPSEDMKVESDPESQKSEYATDTATESVNQDFTEPIKALMESLMTLKSGNVRSEILAPQGDNSEAISKNARRKILYDERIEYARLWVIQQIKNKTILLKFCIMKGKYSNNRKTKMRYFKIAKGLQEKIEYYIDILNDQKKIVKISDIILGYMISNKKNTPKPATKDKNDSQQKKKKD